MLSVLSAWAGNGICITSKRLIHLTCLTACLLLLSAAFVSPLLAYSNKSKGQPDQTTDLVNGPHGKINHLTLLFYQAWLQEKQSKKRVTFDPVFNYQLRDNSVGAALRKIEGESILRSGYFYPWDRFKDGKTAGASYFCLSGSKQLSFPDWLIEGGFTADEPEIWMGLRHFYDPNNGRGLTDFSHDWLTESGNTIFKSLLGRPKMDARTWGLQGPAEQNFKANPWSWEKGIEYMRRALAETRSPAERDALFASAWRALGETMHLLADMTVPAHVRNDSHPGIDDTGGLAPDPYEQFMTESLILSVWKQIIRQKQIYPAVRDAVCRQLREDIGNLDKSFKDFKKKAPSELFDIVASYTNRHFFSADTVSGSATYSDQTIQITNANGQPSYPSPKLDLCNPKNAGNRLLWPDTIYYQEFKMGSMTERDKIRKLPIAQLSWSAAQGWLDMFQGKVQYSGFNASYLVNRSMAAHLLPIAVWANAKLIDWYLPRLEIVLKDLNPDQATLTGYVKHHPFGVHPKSRPLVFNLPEGDAWAQYHELYMDGKKLFRDQYELRVEKNRIFVDLSPVKSQLTASTRLSLVLDLGGIRVKSGTVSAAEDCGYWVLTDNEQYDEKYRWQGEGVSSEHKPGKERIKGSVEINVPQVLSYSVRSELSWDAMPEVIPAGGKWAVAYQGKTERRGRPVAYKDQPGYYRVSHSITSHMPGPDHAVFHIDYRHEEAVSAGSDCLKGGIITRSGLLTHGKGRIKPGKPADRKAGIQFFLASPTWRDPSDGSRRNTTEYFILTGETPAGKLRRTYAYRFVKKLNDEQIQRLKQTLSSPAYRGKAVLPKTNFSSGTSAKPAAGDIMDQTAGNGPRLTALHHVPGQLKKQEPIVFKVDVVNPPEKAAYTWWMYKKFSGRDKTPQPTAWTHKPEIRYTYGKAGINYVTVWLKDKKTGKFVAKQSWQIEIDD